MNALPNVFDLAGSSTPKWTPTGNGSHVELLLGNQPTLIETSGCADWSLTKVIGGGVLQ
jgi:hypothetical protein